jgi:hypothetical protein
MNKQLHNEVLNYLKENFEELAENAAEYGDSSIYIEQDGFTIDIDLINHVEEVEYPGDYLNPRTYELKGSIEVDEIRVYTEDDDFEFKITRELNKVLTLNF